MPNKKILFSVSGVCYGLAFVVSGCWWMTCIWAIPLWWGAWECTLSLPSAFAWYLLAMGGHVMGITAGLYRLSEGPLCMRLVIPLLVFVYYFVLTSLWLVSAAWSAALVRVKGGAWGEVFFLGIWVLATWMYIIGISDYSLCVCSSSGGYALCSPLIPLIEVPCLLWPLKWVSERCLIMAILVLQASMTQGFLRRHVSYSACLILCIWLVGAYNRVGDTTMNKYANCVQYIGVIRSQFFEENAARARRHMECHVTDMMRDIPMLRCIIFPESSVYVPNVFSTGDSIFNTEFSVDAPICIVGGFRYDHGVTYNTVWLIVKGCIVDVYDKQTLLPLTEYIPSWGHYCGIRERFFCAMPELTPAGEKAHPVWSLGNTLHIIPYICSEFFLQKCSPAHEGKLPLLVLCNTTWAPKIMQWMMMRTAAFRAVAWQRTIVYVAHGYSTITTPEGRMYSLKEEVHICDNRSKR